LIMEVPGQKLAYQASASNDHNTKRPKRRHLGQS
jgi:hypothetical protein